MRELNSRGYKKSCPERVTIPRPFRCKRNDLPLIYQDMIDNIANLAFLYHFLSEYNTLELPKNIYYMEIEVTWNKDTTLDLKLT